jgi:predicted O-linked N-acetylglucosamine transferase (SPINDLY family)
VGYFGSVFHDHAMMFLMGGLFREHDAAKFEIHAYSYGDNRSGEWRDRVKNTIDAFHDMAGLSDAEIVEIVRANPLDIAIDLNAHTQRTRAGLFAYRLAPVQINYLGYPGTMGAPFMDYIVADPIVIPESARPFYTEKIISLPHSYQPNDDQRAIADTESTRADFGLPDDGFVFCCFNNNYKISPREFDIWMRVLNKLPGSVLWLLGAGEATERNLRNEAAKRGVDRSRIIFAGKLPHSAHLERQRHADLFIDTFDYNAHTTASDALWAGLPLVTKAGKQFAARVAASLLNAVGLPELVAETDEDYEALILDLATNRERLASIRQKLAANRQSAPLFDSAGYARAFERGLARAYDLYFEGKDPEHIEVGEG